MNELINIEKVTAIQVFSQEGLDPLLEQITKEAKSFVPNLKTVKSRKEIASLAMKVAKSKTFLDSLGKDLVAEQKASIKLVDVERKRMRDTLDALKTEVRQPLTDWEEDQKERAAKIQERFDEMKALGAGADIDGNPYTAQYLKDCLGILLEIVIDDSWGELELPAIKLHRKLITDLEALFELRIKQEKEQIELERLRKEAIEREQKEREERIARDAKETAERAASEKIEAAKREQEAAERAAKDAEDHAKVQEQARLESIRQAEENAKQAAIDAQARAKVEAERAVQFEQERVAQQAKAEEEAVAKREANKRHVGGIRKQAKESLMAIGLDEEAAKRVVMAINNGNIANVTISY